MIDYQNLDAYTRRIMAVPAPPQPVKPDHIKRNYYSMKVANPSGTGPIGPDEAPAV